MESKRSELLRASPRMFENDLLDRFSRVHHFVPLAIFLPVIAVFLYIGFDRVGTAGTLLLGVGGYLFWSLSEYWIHRIIFHWEPEQGWGAKLHWMIHGVHHDHPNDPLRLVMPPAASIPLAGLFVVAFVVVIGKPDAWPFAGGFLAGYLIYDMIHFALHHHRPKTRFGRWLRELHMRHHFQDDTTGYGIAAPYWDWVFRSKVDGARRPHAPPREDKTSEPLSPSDVSAIQAERGPVHMHVGGVLVFEGAITREEIVRRLRERIHLIPRYAMRLDEAPLGIANPVWVQDEKFDPDRHVRRVALPPPGGREQLEELVGDLMSDRLDRSRPLWQLHVVEGLEGGRSALVARMHHALVDGIAAVDVSTVVLDPTPEPLEIEAPAQDPAGSSLARITAARLHVPRKLARDMAARALAADPRSAVKQARSAAALVGELTRIRSQAPATRLNTAIGPDRLFAMAR